MATSTTLTTTTAVVRSVRAGATQRLNSQCVIATTHQCRVAGQQHDGVFWVGDDGSIQDRFYYDGRSGWNGFTMYPAGSSRAGLTGWRDHSRKSRVEHDGDLADRPRLLGPVRLPVPGRLLESVSLSGPC